MLPTDRTAAHVAAIRECAEIDHALFGGPHAEPFVALDTAALTRCVEQIAAEARADALLHVGEWQRHPLPVDRGPLAATPADTTDAASAALVAEIDRHRRDKHYLCSDCGPLHRRLVDALARLDAETARLREDVEAESTTALNYSIVIGQLREEHARLTAERDALRTVLDPDRDHLPGCEFHFAPLDTCDCDRKRLRALAGDAP